MISTLVKRVALPAICWSLMCCSVKAQDIAVVPQPNKVTLQKDSFTVPLNLAVYLGTPDLKEEYALLQQQLKQRGIQTSLVEKEKKAFLVMDVHKISGNQEAYQLQVTASGISIKANAGAGVFYALQTLDQLLPYRTGGKIKLPLLTIEDEPRFAYRGMHLDVSRHFFDTAYVKKYIDLMARYKLNTFHWHLTDDNGWRIEIKKYPALTSVGAWRVDRESMPWRKRPGPLPGEKPTYGGFYTQKQVKDIIKYAAERHITIIPEIEMPAHCLAALAAYPQLACFGDHFDVAPGSYWPNYDIFCAGNDEVFTFLEDVVSEVADLFPAPYLHVGGDEAEKDNWKKCPRCQQRMKDEGLANEHELQSYFIRRIEKSVNKKGKRLIGWDEILEGGLSPTATVMSWRGEEGGVAAAKHGNDVIMTPGSKGLYFDYGQGPREYEPVNIGGYSTPAIVYNYDPVPASLNAKERAHILGVQANLWTEYIPTTQQADYMLMPRMLALSEIAWTQTEVKNWTRFHATMGRELVGMDNRNVHYRIPEPEGLRERTLIDKASYTFTLKPGLPGASVYYTLTGEDPDAGNGTLYKGPVSVSLAAHKPVTVKAATIASNGRSSVPVTGVLQYQATLPAHNVIPTEQGLKLAVIPGGYLRYADLQKANKTVVYNQVMRNFDVAPLIAAHQKFAAWMEGFIYLPEHADYQFSLGSDDASMLWIDDTEVVNNDGDHSFKIKTGNVPAQAGWHRIKILYINAGGAGSLELKMSTASEAPTPVSENNLKH